MNRWVDKQVNKYIVSKEREKETGRWVSAGYAHRLLINVSSASWNVMPEFPSWRRGLHPACTEETNLSFKAAASVSILNPPWVEVYYPLSYSFSHSAIRRARNISFLCCRLISSSWKTVTEQERKIPGPTTRLFHLLRCSWEATISECGCVECLNDNFGSHSLQRFQVQPQICSRKALSRYLRPT